MLAVEINVGMKMKDAFLTCLSIILMHAYFDHLFLIKLYVRLEIFLIFNRALISERTLQNKKLTIIKHL